MLADGLTKALQNNAFGAFIRQLGLVDITKRLDQRREKELHELDLEDYLEYGPK
jgi:hypothetical protein